MTRKRQCYERSESDRGPKRVVLCALVETRFHDGETLLKTGQPQRRNGAVYIAGYGLECALKARICVDLQLDRLPRKYWHHDLLRLAETTTLWPSMAANRDMLDSFKTFVAEWVVGMRYEKVPLEAHATLKFINRARSFAKEFVPWA